MTLIEIEAKKIMDDFIKALEKIDESDLDIGQSREKQMREDVQEEKDEDFRKLMFKNSPQGTQNGFVVSEKKKW